MIFCMSVAEPDPGADAALEDCIVRIAGGDQNLSLIHISEPTRPY